MSKKTNQELSVVKIKYELSRLKDVHLTNAYDKLIPLVKKMIKDDKTNDCKTNHEFSYIK